MKRSLKTLVVTLLVAAITGGILTYAHKNQEPPAKQACLDYIADQSAKGRPIKYQELLNLWSSEESKNLYAEPAILNFLTSYKPDAPKNDDDYPGLSAATDRFTQGMEDCETISWIPVVTSYSNITEVLYDSAVATKTLYDEANARAKTAADDGDIDEALEILQNLHEIEAKRSEHVFGLMDMTIQVLLKLTLIETTQDILTTELTSTEPSITIEQVNHLLDSTRMWNTVKGWGNLCLYERAYQHSFIENLESPSDRNAVDYHPDFLYSGTFYQAQLILWKALENTNNSSSSGWNLASVENSFKVLDNSTSGHTAQNPLLKDDFEAYINTFDETKEWLAGLKTSVIKISAHELLLAAYHQKLSTGTFPKDIDVIPAELLSADRLSLLKSANATLRIESGKIFVDYELPDGTNKTMPDPEP